MVWWLPCENANVLLAAFELLATGVGVDVQAVRQAARDDAASYRRELMRLVYSKLGERWLGVLLVMDNANDAELLSDYIHNRPHNTKVAITTCHATLFADLFPQLELDVFDQAEALDFIHTRLAAYGRKTSCENVAALVAEVGLVPQQLDLAAAYLEKHLLMGTADYVAALRAVKQDSSVQQ